MERLPGSTGPRYLPPVVNLALIAERTGNREGAVAAWTRALGLARELGDEKHRALAEERLGVLAELPAPEPEGS